MKLQTLTPLFQIKTNSTTLTVLSKKPKTAAFGRGGMIRVLLGAVAAFGLGVKPHSATPPVELEALRRDNRVADRHLPDSLAGTVIQLNASCRLGFDNAIKLFTLAPVQ